MPNFERIASENAVDDIECSFCGHTADEGRDFVATEDAVICDECLAECTDVLNQSPPSSAGDEDAESASAQMRDLPETRIVRALSERDVARLLEMDDLIDRMEKTLARCSAGDFPQPAAAAVPLDRDREGLRMGGTVLFFSAESRVLLGVIAGRYLAQARAAAVGAISAKYLARDDAGNLAIIGSGASARSHFAAFDRVFELASVRAWSPTPEDQEALVDHLSRATSVPVEGAHSLEDALGSADLVVIAASPDDVEVREEWIQDGTHVVIDVDGGRAESDFELALRGRGRLFVESRTTVPPEWHAAGELGQLVSKSGEGRRSPREVTVFRSLGLPVLDLVAADLVFHRAEADNLGAEVEL